MCVYACSHSVLRAIRDSQNVPPPPSIEATPTAVLCVAKILSAPFLCCSPDCVPPGLTTLYGDMW